ncbi:hypothetical protein RFI_01240, partial [Reticulomyxa filosa]
MQTKEGSLSKSSRLIKEFKKIKPDDDNIENERMKANKKQKTQFYKGEKELKDENIWKENKKQSIPFCSMFRRDYVSGQLEKLKKKISNPETNRCMLLKNVSTREYHQEVVDTLEELDEVEEVERFKGMPVVKVIFSNAKD